MISLLEPPAPSHINSVIVSPPRTSLIVTTPVHTTAPLVNSVISPPCELSNGTPVTKNCSVSIQDILVSPSPICRRTRNQLRLRQTANLYSSPELSATLGTGPPASQSVHSQIQSVSPDQCILPLDLSPSGAPLCQGPSASHSVTLSTRVGCQLLDPSNSVQANQDCALDSSTSTSSLQCMLPLAPSDDTSGEAFESRTKNSVGKFSEGMLSLSQRRSDDHVHSPLAPSPQSQANLSCHLCSFTADKKSGLRLHLKRTHDTWKVPKQSVTDSPRSPLKPSTHANSVKHVLTTSALQEDNSPVCTDSNSSSGQICDNASAPKELSKAEIEVLRNMKTEKLSMTPPPSGHSSAPEGISSPSLDEQLKLTPSPGQRSPVLLLFEVDTTPVKMRQVEYFPFSLRCAYCDLDMSSPTSFADHILEVHSGFSEAQKNDVRTFAKSNQPAKDCDIVSSDEEMSYQCTKCNEAFPSEAHLLQHACSPSPSRTWKCVLCSHVARKRSGLRFHMRAKHNTWKIVTDRSGLPKPNILKPPAVKRLQFSPPSSPDVVPAAQGAPLISFPISPPGNTLSLLDPICSQSQQAGEPRFQCQNCSFFASSASILEVHLGNSHSPKFALTSSSSTAMAASIQCPECRAPCANSTELLAHDCRPTDLATHPPSSSPVRNCPACGFLVTVPDDKVEDVLLYHINKRHTCKLCDFVEIKRGDLGDHMKSHRRLQIKNKPHAVRNLEPSLALNQKNPPTTPLTTLALPSVRPPTNDPPPPAYVCSGCGTGFTFAFFLDVHCARCPQFLALSDNSFPSQTRMPLFKCNACPFVGKDASNLTKHLAVKHKVVMSFDIDFSNTPASQDSGHLDDPPRQESSPIGNPKPDSSPTSGLASKQQIHKTAAPSEMPPEHCRMGNTLNLIFPMLGGLKCTEKDCPFEYHTKGWTSTKNSLIRHLYREHKIDITTSYLWCSKCRSRTSNKPSSHPCLKDSPLADQPGNSHKWKCNICSFSSPSETGLNNHLLAHKKKRLLAAGPQKVTKTYRKTPRRGKVVPIIESEDEKIDAPGTSSAPVSSNLPLTPPPSRAEMDNSLLGTYIKDLESLLASDPTDEAFLYFCNTIDQAVAETYSFTAGTPPPERRDGPVKRRKIDILDARTIQVLYGKNRKRAVREIWEDTSEFCTIPPAALETHFSEAWGPNQAEQNFYNPSNSPRSELLSTPFSAAEVGKKLSKAENTSAGPDGVTYLQWRSVEYSANFLAAAFNACLHFRRIPPKWKESSTILLPKSGDLSSPSNWRPIALSSTIYKILTKCLAARLSDWCEKYNILSPCQKGFTPFDGVVEHNYVLQQRKGLASSKKKDLCIAWLDVTNAFGALPHTAIFEALGALGTGQLFVDLVSDIYTDSSSKILASEGATRQIPILSGVKQGCPISGLLFNICIDPIIRTLQGDSTSHKVLAFADDVCILAESPGELQLQLNTIFSQFAKIGLALNPRKSVSMHFSGATPAGTRNTSFKINNTPIRALKEGEFHKFLGKPVGYNPCPDYRKLEEFYDLAMAVLQSKLAPWQRIDALLCFVFPALQFAMRTGQFMKTEWDEFDRALRKGIKDTLGLPDNACNDYLYGHRKFGCIGIPITAEDSDLYRIDTAFKLLTSKDEKLALMALQDLQRTVRLRFGIASPSDRDLENYMSGCQFQDRDNCHSNEWTVARLASSRLSIRWEFDEGIPRLKFEDTTIRSFQRRRVIHSLRDMKKTIRANNLLLLPKQGKAMECVAQSPASSHFVANGTYTRFCDWAFVHSARLDLLKLNGTQPWKVNAQKRCRWCSKGTLETLPHVLCHCEVHSRAWQLRHDSVGDRVVTAISPRGHIVAKNQTVGPKGLKPDIVFQKGKKMFVIDITIPFENRLDSFAAARQRKLDKYDHLIEFYNNMGFQTSIIPIVVGALGSWDKGNDAFLSRFMSKSYLKKFQQLCVSDVIKWSRDIFVEHVTGVRQYTDPNTSRPNPISRQVGSSSAASASNAPTNDVPLGQLVVLPESQPIDGVSQGLEDPLDLSPDRSLRD
ncbi:Retrovirus-related Pol polyprotein from type-1 retrotransposable element R2 [Araneus ventricosus]|uniref:Retrovirus-related Pol polyprotein from type-1 retrotransposable element R2 n=1 Tax=Araneus ventricosus TaxID=182803 RepID=A0A4Y2X3J4_ARAVE|nr:Retrovirus-related Pol polyprotein from type-1 retrotransposable element R2 [Araneus ventricosus]